MRSPTGTYAEGNNRWVYVGKTQVPPPEFYGKARRSFKIGMITTVDPSDGEDMYLDSTDAESPPRVEGPPNEETKEEPRMEKKAECGGAFEDEGEQEGPPPPEYHTTDEDHISPARRTNRREAELGGSLVPYSYSTRGRSSLLDPNYQSRHLSPSQVFGGSPSQIFGTSPAKFPTIPEGFFSSSRSNPLQIQQRKTGWLVDYSQPQEDTPRGH